ncbi:hypothetical protein FHL15_000826 [Xylaria flabelliformis]|uniref:Actin cytoskeleton-regulatory complex protein SLA1 n=1 Tax=Xylaria flabelliformis TaxID=2512241 RepID=A0A553IDB2_9PEZI|nr:hypothetical protein FHL15_000826 [Xylaria flabelliformis]
MGFLGIYKAVYDYTPQSEGELSISEGDLLCVLEKSQEDDWWKAKKKASADEEDEPIGLVPNNYVEEAKPVGQARSLYEYTRQTDEELSFPEDAPLRVYDASDPDWILVGFESDFGFVPANYIEMGSTVARQEPEPEAEREEEVVSPPLLPTRPVAPVEPDSARSPPLPDRPTSTPSLPSPSGPAAALAGVMQGRSSTRAPTPPPITVPPRQPRPYVEEPRAEPSPPLPVRRRSQSTVSNDQFMASPPLPKRTSSRRYSDNNMRPQSFSSPVPGGFHMYNINEMVSVMGKKKKMPTTLGVNLKTGVILIAPEKAQDGPTQEWTAEKMTHYSREGKHVFLELVRPSKSIDFHAGAKDTAEEIVSALGELSGAVKAEGLREVIAAGTGKGGQKRGQILYDFVAQGDDEVTVEVGDEVIILDDTKSEEWWQVRRLKNGKEGVVPSSYVERGESIITPSTAGINAGMSSVAQNRQDEARLTREAVKKDQKAAEVGPGLPLPERQSSLSAGHSGNISIQQRSRHENGRTDTNQSRPSKSSKLTLEVHPASFPSDPLAEPDPSKVRVWTDRSKSFSVEAQFLGLKDGKINLHKMNGVKIAVPLAKMAMEDIEYVERTMGISLDEEKPLADVKRAKTMRNNINRGPSPSNIGASVQPPKSDYDWFQFFLSCDVAVGLCERYAQAFARDSMDESVLPDVDVTVLRNLGLKEGDVIKVMRYLDKKFDREGKRKNAGEGDGENAGGLFSGPGGTLRNNTRKGRPAPAVQTSDVIDAKALSQPKDGETGQSASPPPEESRSNAPNKASSGFDDDAWDVKPARQPTPQSKPAPNPEPKTTPAQPQPPPSQAMQDLSLLSAPLEPTKVEPPAPAPATNTQQQQTQALNPLQPAQTAAQPQGATPSFFSSMPAAPTGPATPAQPLNLGLGNRQRPTPPQVVGGQGALMPPPPARPLSAPQSAQSSGFAPPPIPALQAQVTGIAPLGQSLNELNQQRFQQPYLGNFQQPTGQGFMQLNPAMNMPQPTGFGSQQFMVPQMTGAPQMQSPFSDPRAQQFSPVPAQPTGYPSNFQPPQQFPQQTGINTYLPPALEPQRTSIPPQSQVQPQQTGFGGFGGGFNPALNGQPQPQPPPAAPLLPQKTGPAPPVRFGVPNKIAPQPTGRRANLAQATPDNPFGF